MIKTGVFLKITLLFFLGYLFIFSGQANSLAEQTEAKSQAIPVTTTEVGSGELELTVTAMGSLESPATPLVSAEISAKILTLSVEEGDTVKRGQVLAKLDTELYQIELIKAEADLKKLNAVISNQQVNLTRFQTLLKKQLTAQSEYDNARTELAVSEAEVAGVRARMKEIQYYLGKSQVLSPVNAAVYKRLVSEGNYTQQGSPLFQLVITDKLRARLFLPETVAPHITIGLPVSLSLGSDQKSSVTATISRLRPMLETENRALEILVEFSNEHHWKPGYTAKGEIVLEKRQDTMFVPEASVVRRPAGEVVYLVNGNRVEQRIVKTGTRKGGSVEILEGLTLGQKIVVDGAGFLSEGASITIGSML